MIGSVLNFVSVSFRPYSITLYTHSDLDLGVIDIESTTH